MRRYATKRSSEDDYYESESYTYTSSAAAEDSWGTTEGYKSLGPQQYAAGENPLSNKRIFLVLWRVKSSRKHKNWTGNGTLELTSTEATLKDETGKDLGVLTHFEGDEFYQNALLDIGIRDVEIQNELTTIEECIAQRKAEYDFWYRQHTNVIEVAPAMVSKPYIPAALRRRKKLKKPLADVDTNTSAVYTHPIQQFVVSEHDTATSQPIQQFIANEHDSATSQPIQQFEASEYICLLKPAQLQMETLQLLSDYYQDLETPTIQQKAQVQEIAQHICDHPVLLKQLLNRSITSEVLLPQLPDWQDMGVYDSAKFQFVHLMLDTLVADQCAKCAIVANNMECLNIIKGYCQCWQIPHVQMDNYSSDEFNDASSSRVALFVTSQLPDIRITNCRTLIIYNYNARHWSYCQQTATLVYIRLLRLAVWKSDNFKRSLVLLNLREL